MLTKEQFHNEISQGLRFLDGATGSNLRAAGMPREACTEQWVLENPQVLTALQQQFAEAGSQILYAPTFQAQPLALERIGMSGRTEEINRQLVSLSRSAAPQCLIAGDLTTLAAFCDSWDENHFDLLLQNYRRQIRGLIDGGADLLVAETLMYPQEAEAICTAAELEGAECVMYSFVLNPDGSLLSGADALPLLRDLEAAGAAALGFNCVAADSMTPYLVTRLHRSLRCPILCKPNAGIPVIDENAVAQYAMTPEEFAGVAAQCAQSGAALLGGCCGTTPAHIAALTKRCKNI